MAYTHGKKQKFIQGFSCKTLRAEAARKTQKEEDNIKMNLMGWCELDQWQAVVNTVMTC
jgi:hypothetical protein